MKEQIPNKDKKPHINKNKKNKRFKTLQKELKVKKIEN